MSARVRAGTRCCDSDTHEATHAAAPCMHAAGAAHRCVAGVLHHQALQLFAQRLTGREMVCQAKRQAGLHLPCQRHILAPGRLQGRHERQGGRAGGSRGRSMKQQAWHGQAVFV